MSKETELAPKSEGFLKTIASNKNIKKAEKGVSIAGAAITIFGGILKIFKIIQESTKK